MRRPVDAEMPPDVVETDGDGATGLTERSTQIDAQARDRRPFDRICGALRKCRQSRVRFWMGARKELAFGPMQLQIEDEVTPALPRVLRRERRPGGEKLQSRGVRCRGFGALACDQVELGQLLALLPGSDQGGAAVELTHDLEDRLFPVLSRRPRDEMPPNPKVSRGALLLRDQRVRGFLHPVVDEPVE